MNRVLISLLISICSLAAFSQSSSEITVQTISPDSSAVFRLFATRNTYTFIRINTRNGQMWQVQWGTESKYRFQNTLSEVIRVSKEEEKNGRFFLYPTKNIYNFILLDQISGRTWQVQWGDEADRAVIPIY